LLSGLENGESANVMHILEREVFVRSEYKIANIAICLRLKARDDIIC